MKSKARCASTCRKYQKFKYSILSNTFGIRIASGLEFEDDEVGWDSPLIRLENDLHSSSRYTVDLANCITVRCTIYSNVSCVYFPAIIYVLQKKKRFT